MFLLKDEGIQKQFIFPGIGSSWMCSNWQVCYITITDLFQPKIEDRRCANAGTHVRQIRERSLPLFRMMGEFSTHYGTSSIVSKGCKKGLQYVQVGCFVTSDGYHSGGKRFLLAHR